MGVFFYKNLSSSGFQGFKFQLFFSSKEVFITRAARTPPTIGARMKIQTVEEPHTTNAAGAELRASLIESPADVQAARIKAVND